jgi:hypothetical protein
MEPANNVERRNRSSAQGGGLSLDTAQLHVRENAQGDHKKNDRGKTEDDPLPHGPGVHIAALQNTESDACSESTATIDSRPIARPAVRRVHILILLASRTLSLVIGEKTDFQ